MSIDKIMSKKLVTVRVNDTLSDIKTIFDTNKFHHILVTDKKILVGIISDRDLLKSLSPYIGSNIETFRDTATLDRQASEVMSTSMITLHADNEIKEAISLFNKHSVSCIPIVDSDQKPVGIVSWRDIMRTLEFLYKKGRQ